MAIRHTDLLLLALSLAASAPAQRPTELDPEIPAQLKELRDAVMDRRMEFDGEAIRILEALKAKHDLGMHERDERRVIDGVARVFVQGRLRDPERTDLYVLAAEFLADCGQLGARQLLKAYESSRIKSREYAELRAEILVNLGKTKEPALIELFLKESRISPDNEVLAAAGATTHPRPRVRRGTAAGCRPQRRSTPAGGHTQDRRR